MAASDSGSSSTRKTTKKTTKKAGTKASKKPSTSTSRKSAEDSGTTKKTPASRSSSGSAPKAESRPAARASQVAAQAAAELLELTGKGVEGVTGLERTDDGWTVHVEVVEVRRIPDTTDVLALYEIETDKQGSLLGYRRLRRYARGTAGDD